MHKISEVFYYKDTGIPTVRPKAIGPTCSRLILPDETELVLDSLEFLDEIIVTIWAVVDVRFDL